MRRGIKTYCLATGAVFLEIVLLVATCVTLRQHPMIARVTDVLLYPVYLGATCLSYMWVFNDESKYYDFFTMLCFGVLILLTSALYAGAGLLLFRLCKRYRPERIAK